MKKYLLFFLIIFLFSCAQESNTLKTIDLAKEITKTNPNKIVFEDLFTLKNIIIPVTNDSILLSHFNLIDIDSNKIGIYDSGNFYLLNKESGKLISRINQKGRGEGEYINIMDLTVNTKENKVYILDAQGRKINIYNLEGNYIGFISNDSIGSINILENGDFLTTYSGFISSDFYVASYDSLWNLKINYIQKVNYELVIRQFENIFKYNNEFFFKPSFVDTIFNVNSESYLPFLQVNLGNLKMPMDFRKDLYKLNDEASKYIEGFHYRIIKNYFFAEYYYNNISYYDIWDIETTQLLYRSKFNRENDIYGFPIMINGEKINVWPKYMTESSMYIVLDYEDGVKFVPELDLNSNPVILEVEIH